MADKPKNPTPGQNLADGINLWSLAGELGIKLALPLVVFMLIGIKVDHALHTTPLFIILGILLAMATSVYFVYDLIKRANQGLK